MLKAKQDIIIGRRYLRSQVSKQSSVACTHNTIRKGHQLFGQDQPLSQKRYNSCNSDRNSKPLSTGSVIIRASEQLYEGKISLYKIYKHQMEGL